MDVDIFELGPREGAEMDILIPSCKAIKQLRGIYADIQRNTTGLFRLIIAGNPGVSAARNRNACMNHSHAQYIIMMDDDITRLFPSWNQHLIRELKSDTTISIVSARLIHWDRSPAAMMSSKYILNTDLEEVKKVPTACIAFRKTSIRFDENFKGSGFEDDAFCLAMGPRIVIDNRVKVIHLNEMKHQQENWDHNKKYFEEAYASRPL